MDVHFILCISLHSFYICYSLHDFYHSVNSIVIYVNSIDRIRYCFN